MYRKSAVVELLSTILTMYAVHRVESTPVFVKVSSQVGEIIGTEVFIQNSDSDGFTVQNFLGIPYAEAPRGNLRFRKPVPKSVFNAPFNATRMGPICYQNGFTEDSKYRQSEDCLTLNIYVPVTASSQLKPVMVWIHGGSFKKGTSYDYDGSMLSKFGDVVIVTINYRLTYLGFFTTGDSTAPGNFGLWDQQLAIKWTSKNIQAFGGDPKRITLFGGSAGASSVIYHTFYPGNRGLFQRAIAQSGSITSPWAFEKKSLQVESYRKFANTVGCNGTAPGVYTECLRSLPIEDLHKAIRSVPTDRPVLDNEFILDEPDNLVSGHTKADSALEMFHSVDLIIGINNGDGMMDLPLWMAVTSNTNPKQFELSVEDMAYKIVPNYISNYHKVDYITDVVNDMILFEYGSFQMRDRIINLIKLVTNCYVGIPAVKTADRHVKDNRAGTSTYVYEFAIQTLDSNNFPDILQGLGICQHGDEIRYVFGQSQNINQNTEDKALLMSQYKTYLLTMTMWTNFAQSGNPNWPNDVTKYMNTAWPQFSSNDRDYLIISSTMSSDSVKTGMRQREIHFWTEILRDALNYKYDDYDDYYDDSFESDEYYDYLEDMDDLMYEVLAFEDEF